MIGYGSDYLFPSGLFFKSANYSFDVSNTLANITNNWSWIWLLFPSKLFLKLVNSFLMFLTHQQKLD